MRTRYPAFLVAVMLLASAFAFHRLPNEVPIHWDLQGQSNGYTSPLIAAVGLPGLVIAVWLLMKFVPSIDPWRANYPKMQSAYDVMVNGVLTVLAIGHLLNIGEAIGLPISVVRAIPAVVAGMFALIGSVLPRAQPNFWFGIRTPWTLANTRVWERTHHVGGYLMVGAGVLGIVSAILPIEFAILALVILGAGASLISVVYSYFAWRQETSR